MKKGAVPFNKAKSFRAIGLDRGKRQTEQDLSYMWAIAEGKGTLDKYDGEVVIYNAANEPGLSKLKLTIRQAETVCNADAVVTIVDSLLKTPVENSEFSNKGLPGYTLEGAA